MKAVGNDRGSVIVFITLMIVLLMVMVGMGLDVGQLGYTRATAQPAVDAAALAAVSGLPSRNLNTIRDRAKAFNSTNTFTNSQNVKISDSSITLVEYNWSTGEIKAAASIDSANGVRVAMESSNPHDQGATNTPVKSPLFLTPLFNLMGLNSQASQNVSVSAVAVATSLPAVPIALWAGLCNTSGPQKIKMQHPDKKDDDGSENACWTTFLDCSSGAADIRALFTQAASCTGSGMTGTIQIGTPICQNRGQVTTSLRTAEDFFFTQNQKGDWWLVPVIGGGGNCDPNNPSKVTNWAKIRPSQVKDTSKDKYILADIDCNPNLPKTIIESNLCFSNKLVRDIKSGM